LTHNNDRRGQCSAELIGSYELLMMLIRAESDTTAELDADSVESHSAPPPRQDAPPEPETAPPVDHVVRERYKAGASQRAIARELGIDRRKVKRIIEQPA
jgi:pyruvate/2-oxoglutarate dehydrogenase complex dihydrolipoamide acyltransferase (E2) component